LCRQVSPERVAVQPCQVRAEAALGQLLVVGVVDGQLGIPNCWRKSPTTVSASALVSVFSMVSSAYARGATRFHEVLVPQVG
jgi:hypothetical protein